MSSHHNNEFLKLLNSDHTQNASRQFVAMVTHVDQKGIVQSRSLTNGSTFRFSVAWVFPECVPPAPPRDVWTRPRSSRWVNTAPYVVIIRENARKKDETFTKRNKHKHRNITEVAAQADVLQLVHCCRNAAPSPQMEAMNGANTIWSEQRVIKAPIYAIVSGKILRYFQQHKNETLRKCCRDMGGGLKVGVTCILSHHFMWRTKFMFTKIKVCVFKK